jgi:hypothetical protein
VRAARQGIALAGEDLAWLDWVEVHVTETDPLLNRLAPPDPPEATPQNLKPFLGGVNPHGIVGEARLAVDTTLSSKVL